MGVSLMTNPDECGAIEALRKVANTSVRTRVKPAAICRIVDGLVASEFRDTITAAVGLSPESLTELVVEFGTWLGQVRRGAVNPAVSPFEVGRLFAVGTARDQVVVPHGFETHVSGRNVARAVANIVTDAPDEALITRFVLRRDHQVVIPLTWGYVSMTHVVAQLGRLGEFDALATRSDGRPNAALARVVVQAFDLLDVARLDAARAVEALVGFADGPIDPIAFEHAATAASWVAEREVGRLRRLAALDENHLRRELKHLRRAVEANPARWRPARVGDLTGAQVLRIAQRAGLDTSATYDGSEVEAREAIAAAGLSQDADQLLGVGVHAIRAGLGAALSAALSRRAAGDLGWAEDLNAALAAH